MLLQQVYSTGLNVTTGGTLDYDSTNPASDENWILTSAPTSSPLAVGSAALVATPQALENTPYAVASWTPDGILGG